ncbi:MULTISPECIES: hypothetical protein [Rhizobium]|uniref:hypothetical protein n=1 Tax=Rhizobium TaxID=379 RepID=UPI001057A076|nr:MULTISPECIES: hypothetical protein [Rhizobium]
MIFSSNVKVLFFGLWLVAICLATAATHGRADLPLLGPAISGLSQVGETLFPVIAKYRTHLRLSEAMLFRIQGVASSVWLAALATMVIYYLRIILFTPEQRALVIKEMSNNLKRSHHARRLQPGVFLLSSLFLSLLSLASYLGWFSFGEWDGSSPKECYVAAACYAELHGLEVLFVVLMESILVVWLPLSMPLSIWYFLKRDVA